MRRLCTDSSRSYLGRSASRAVRRGVTFPDRTTPDYQGPGAAASCPPHAMNRQQSPPAHSAPRGNVRRDDAEVSRGHSSGQVLHKSGRPRRTEHAKQGGAAGGSPLDVQARPGQSSAAQARAADLVRVLCVVREDAYRTWHEPPTADPHGGWCGGRWLAAGAYPIRRRFATAHLL